MPRRHKITHARSTDKPDKRISKASFFREPEGSELIAFRSCVFKTHEELLSWINSKNIDQLQTDLLLLVILKLTENTNENIFFADDSHSESLETLLSKIFLTIKNRENKDFNRTHSQGGLVRARIHVNELLKEAARTEETLSTLIGTTKAKIHLNRLSFLEAIFEGLADIINTSPPTTPRKHRS